MIYIVGLLMLIVALLSSEVVAELFLLVGFIVGIVMIGVILWT